MIVELTEMGASAKFCLGHRMGQGWHCMRVNLRDKRRVEKREDMRQMRRENMRWKLERK